jgi:hypothetical protein
MDNSNGSHAEGATLGQDVAARPGDYPLGSLESRAAARVMIDSNKQEETVIRIVYVDSGGEGGWTEKEGPLIRVPAPRV